MFVSIISLVTIKNRNLNRDQSSRQRLSLVEIHFLKKSSHSARFFSFFNPECKNKWQKRLSYLSARSVYRYFKQIKNAKVIEKEKDLPIRKTLESRRTSYNACKVDNDFSLLLKQHSILIWLLCNFSYFRFAYISLSCIHYLLSRENQYFSTSEPL